MVGDSHVYGNAPEPFAQDRVDDLILQALDNLFVMPGRKIINRWCGTYASASDRTVLVDKPADNNRLYEVVRATRCNGETGQAGNRDNLRTVRGVIAC